MLGNDIKVGNRAEMSVAIQRASISVGLLQERKIFMIDCVIK